MTTKSGTSPYLVYVIGDAEVEVFEHVFVLVSLVVIGFARRGITIFDDELERTGKGGGHQRRLFFRQCHDWIGNRVRESVQENE